MTEPVLKLCGITKTFGSVTANQDVTLHLRQGEMLALLGENGAGKTTLMSILFGHYVADSGTVEVFGRPLPQGTPRAALAAGVGMVHQHFTLAANMTVLDNIMLGTESLLSPARDTRAALARLTGLMDRFGLRVHPSALVGRLCVGERQRVEILKALFRDARILILDEPTAVLTPQEAEHLFATLRQLVDQGLSVIFITHKLREVMAASDRCVVLRHGRVVFESATAGTTAGELARAMVGSDIPRTRRPEPRQGGEILSLDAITVRGHTNKPLLDGLNLNLNSHEILGIAGVSGNGQTQLADLLSGLIVPHHGQMVIHGQRVHAPSPAGMIALGVGRVPDDRTGTGLVADMTVLENLATEVYRLPGFARRGIMNFKALASRARQLVEAFDVRCPGIDAPVRTLSGGNMQKLILARVLSGAPSVILVNQPTWGLDVGATAYVHQQLLDAAARGAGVVLISEDLDELFQVADRIQVMYQGSLSAPVPTAQVDRAELGLLMSGDHVMPDNRAMPGAAEVRP
ncbi:MAG: ABC transporter ATP-binding protein [Pseudodesulfovibrio sp.]|uniref:ABC transporter related protein n=1 Tax=Pseudodesulfovibrio aespoeensis (strain ATCC 700646 / DSM 10631 / Aspo-2) TaxID=643562 RepID=E6VVR5_PSEA9|nr:MULTISPECIES: ABC transporter ATP-binding protein [Pseudodesulfovibrio]MBU4191502.1 ABC transporter ATP-binding protein [Pseudomonadota bacterium]ADU61267.1 ABC transporter related protein [Pseudodesulfovibrio aespoeensis Aspo-2]MBU4243951.1 ABC transporter ATP-binding protein [Pseudomonadota bacterium]MBU4379115.1 ABC transporter ATP-binding protein [Pseudomonadota bacterium]MBU4476782.1 ABC transporter ATP-binding protein [Pseudomonadota bacterium]